MENQEIHTVKLGNIEYCYFENHKVVSSNGWYPQEILRIVMSGREYNSLSEKELVFMRLSHATLQVRAALRLLLKLVGGAHIDVLAEYLIQLNKLIKQVEDES